MLLKTHQYISLFIVAGIVLIALWPLLAHAITTDGEDFYTSPTDLVALTASTGISQGSKQPPEGTLDRIAWCESHNSATARNPHSSASGRFQFLTSSWEHYGIELWGSTEGKSVFNYRDNTELAEYVYSKYGTRDWLSSKGCWG